MKSPEPEGHMLNFTVGGDMAEGEFWSSSKGQTGLTTVFGPVRVWAWAGVWVWKDKRLGIGFSGREQSERRSPTR